jgi:hypothetical protein
LRLKDQPRRYTNPDRLIGDDAVAYILECLNKTPIGVKQARMVRGVLVQAKSAFAFQPSELLRFA